MASITSIKNKISNLIERYGNDIEIKTSTGTSQDAYGRITHTESTVSTTGVFDSYSIARMRLFTQGKMGDGQTEILLKGDETVDKSSVIVKGGTRYKVLDLTSYEASNVTVAYKLTVSEE